MHASRYPWDCVECGESGIRTHDTLSSIHAFQACQFNHSCISPWMTYKYKEVFLEMQFRKCLSRTSLDPLRCGFDTSRSFPGEMNSTAQPPALSPDNIDRRSLSSPFPPHRGGKDRIEGIIRRYRPLRHYRISCFWRGFFVDSHI